MDNPGEILRLCRLCLVKDQVNIPIFEEQGDIRQIFLKISSCLPVKVSLEDKLPKRICDGCSNKLDLLYEFWNTSANAEKTLLSWLGQAGVKDADETISAVAQQIAKPAETHVKQEALDEGHASNQVHDSFGVQSFDEEAKDESEAPPPKRARRTAAVKAQINLTPESDEDDDMDSAEAMTKVEDESDESDGEDKDPSYGEIPGTSADDQAGPSGVGKDGVEAPIKEEPCDLMPQVLNQHRPDFLNCKEKLEQFDGHEQESTTVPYFRCTQCPKMFTEMPHLEKHIEKHQYKYRCKNCDKRFQSTLCLNEHKIRYHIVERYSGTDCDKTIITKRSKVKEKKLIQCDICGKNYKNIERHKKVTHFKISTVQCELCSKGFLLPCQLRYHMAHNHENAKVVSIPCTHEGCLKVFKSRYSLQYHLDAMHREEKFEKSCEQCGKSFTHPHWYKKHVRMHENGLLGHPCLVCKKVLATKTSWNDHMRHHSGERPFMCELCGQSFITTKALRAHAVVHTKEKPYACSHCDKKYTQRAPLSLHIRKCHTEMSTKAANDTKSRK